MESYVAPVLIVLLLVGIVLALVVFRSYRAANKDDLNAPELSQPTDYTSLTVEEPQTLGERFRNASPVTRTLLVLLPIGLVALLVALYYLLAPTQPVTTIPPSTITNVTAEVAGVDKIRVSAQTENLPDGAQVTARMQEDGADFNWVNADTANGRVDNNTINMILSKSRTATQPREDAQYTVLLNAQGASGQPVNAESVIVNVPAPLRADFYGVTASVPTVEPTVAPPTVAPPTVAPPTVAPPTVAPEATAVPTATYTATVFNGGNIREQPSLSGRVLGQLQAGQTVTLQQRSADGQWYFLVAPDATGWASATLLTVDQTVAGQVPTPTPQAGASGQAGTVFNGGRIRSGPVFGENQVGTINAGENVQLLAKTADGQWYQITDPRGTTGWVYFNLLRVPADVTAALPVGP